jgi:hypothetical protein
MTETSCELSPQQLAQRQRSHVLIVLGSSQNERRAEFESWYCGAYRCAVKSLPGVLELALYRQESIDITLGQNARLPFDYLGFCEICVDGAAAAGSLIEAITSFHQAERSALDPATWLYYPSSERVGRPPGSVPAMMTVAFANSVAGQEMEFREWYATRHIRHALNIRALVSGQCFQLTGFQKPGSMYPSFGTIAVYEQEGTPQSIIESFCCLPHETFHFPTLDESRFAFAEAVYRLLRP